MNKNEFNKTYSELKTEHMILKKEYNDFIRIWKKKLTNLSTKANSLYFKGDKLYIDTDEGIKPSFKSLPKKMSFLDELRFEYLEF